MIRGLFFHISICLMLLLRVVGALADDCQHGELLVGEPGTSKTCSHEFGEGSCIRPDHVYFYTGAEWVLFNGRSITTPPTDKWLSGGAPYHEFLYVADLRDDTTDPVVVGVLAARETNRRNSHINIYRNALNDGHIPAIDGNSDKSAYQKYMVENYSGTRYPDLNAWLKVPGYSGQPDTSRPLFRYERNLTYSEFWNISMKIRTVGNILSCTPFRLGFSSATTNLDVKVFVQSKPAQAYRISARIAPVLETPRR